MIGSERDQPGLSPRRGDIRRQVPKRLRNCGVRLAVHLARLRSMTGEGDLLLLLSEMRALATGGEARRRRQWARASLSEVGLHCHVTAPTVYRWEKGQSIPTGEPAVRYAKLLAYWGELQADRSDGPGEVS